MFFYIKNFISENELKKINKFINDNKTEFELSSSTDKQPSINIYGEDISYLFRILSNRLMVEIEKKVLLKVSNENLGTIVEYRPGMSLHLHVDHPNKTLPKPPPTWKDISSVIYYNNNYTGGEIVFPKQDIILTPDPGSVLIFSSYEPYKHEVKPVISGYRYITPSFWNILPTNL